MHFPPEYDPEDSDPNELMLAIAAVLVFIVMICLSIAKFSHHYQP